MAEHDPIPWRISKNPGRFILDADGAPIADMDYFHQPNNAANAALIVRAVNSHDALVAALTNMIAVYWGSGDGHLPEPACIQDARAALALSEQDGGPRG